MADLFSDLEDDKKTSIGKTEVEYKTASSILTKASGFMETYDYTLNPYSGCSFGCTYCYVAFYVSCFTPLLNTPFMVLGAMVILGIIVL